MWSGVIDCDVIILAVEEALKYNVRNINYVDRILQSWSKKGLKTANDVKRYKSIWESRNTEHREKYRQYDFKELERKLLDRMMDRFILLMHFCIKWCYYGVKR
ncbi:DnaD domain-containing protein [Clostridium ljungdahlii]